VEQGKQGMPQDLTGVYGTLQHDLAELHAKWTVFSQLYATNEERVELLNASAPQFFRLCQDVFINDILITISRLTDPRQTSGKDNLSMERLVVSVDGAKNPDLKGEIERLLAEAKSKCQFARELRNRRLAHSDLLTKLQAPTASLPDATKGQVEEALAALRAIMNAVEAHFEDNTVLYEQVLMTGDGDNLIARLHDARTYREQKRTF
jgi:hypothetical protein